MNFVEKLIYIRTFNFCTPILKSLVIGRMTLFDLRGPFEVHDILL